MKVVGRHGRAIPSWKAWEKPVAAYHWRAGRSAMEIARAFFRHGDAQLPEPLAAVLRRHPSLAGFVADEAHPEFRTPLPPRGARGPRNHDVWVQGHVRARQVRIGIEGKADEPFGDRLATQLKKASKQGARMCG